MLILWPKLYPETDLDRTRRQRPHDDLPKAFADIIAHLRTAYTITYASPLNTANLGDRRVRVKVNRPNADVRLSPAVRVNKDGS